MITIEQMLEAETEDVFILIAANMASIYKEVITDGVNYLVLPGPNPIALVAHIDTLPRKQVKINRVRNIITNPGEVLGADDRAGVWGIMEAARRMADKKQPLPTLIFTNFEESGGLGVAALLKSKKLCTKDIKLFVEMDRMGCTEYVFYSWELPVEVKIYVESFGWAENQGSYSDITDLTDETEIPSVNVSCGYYHQHTKYEVLHVDELLFAVDRVVRMLMDPIDELYEVDNSFADYSYFGSNVYPIDRARPYVPTAPISGVKFQDEYSYEGFSSGWPTINTDALSDMKHDIYLCLMDEISLDKFEPYLSPDEQEILQWVSEEFEEACFDIDESDYWKTFTKIWNKNLLG